MLSSFYTIDKLSIILQNGKRATKILRDCLRSHRSLWHSWQVHPGLLSPSPVHNHEITLLQDVNYRLYLRESILENQAVGLNFQKWPLIVDDSDSECLKHHGFDLQKNWATPADLKCLKMSTQNLRHPKAWSLLKIWVWVCDFTQQRKEIQKNV